MKLKDSIILILAVIIAIAVGVFVGWKLGERSYDVLCSDDKQNNIVKEEKLTLESAKKLMEKYIVDWGCGFGYIANLDNENDKNYLSFKLSESEEIVKCQVLKDEGMGNNNQRDSVILDQCFLDEKNNSFEHQLYDYNDVLQNKRALFGDNATVEKKTVNYDVDKYYYYSSSKNGLIKLLAPGAMVVM